MNTGSPADVPLFSFKHQNLSDPPFFGSVSPIVKENDGQDKRPQETPFFNSRQFCLWKEGELTQYNQLVDVLVKWKDRGWCDFTEVAEWVEAKENWTSWVKYYALLQIPAEEMHLYLYEMDIMRININVTSTKESQ